MVSLALQEIEYFEAQEAAFHDSLPSPLRATAITRMFNRGIPEKVIAETSGHRSTKALRCYEQTCEQQRQAVTAVINQAEFVSTVKEETKTVTKVKKEEEIEKKENIAPSLAPPSLSGNFSNCTINISLK